jgi:hypothetical protein
MGSAGIGDCRSASARLRTISPISLAMRLAPPDNFGLGFTGRPGMRAIVLRFSFLFLFGRLVGINYAPPAFTGGSFSDKCLKNWYLSALERPRGAVSGCPFRGRICAADCASGHLLTHNATVLGKINADGYQTTRPASDYAIDARITQFRHENSPNCNGANAR